MVMNNVIGKPTHFFFIWNKNKKLSVKKSDSNSTWKSRLTTVGLLGENCVEKHTI